MHDSHTQELLLQGHLLSNRKTKSIGLSGDAHLFQVREELLKTRMLFNESLLASRDTTSDLAYLGQIGTREKCSSNRNPNFVHFRFCLSATITTHVMSCLGKVWEGPDARLELCGDEPEHLY